jgi:hypothetical protein
MYNNNTNPIGYIICETYAEPQDISHVKMINGKVVCEGIIQTADEKNRNGRYYAKEELFPQLKSPRIIELLETGNLKAECGHPLSKDLQRQSTIDPTKVCARFLNLRTEGNNIIAQFIGTNNDLGKAFDLDLKEGIKPSWSLRALGSIAQTNKGCEVKNLRVITWDNVIYPSHPHAYTTGFVTESGIINSSHNSNMIVEGNDMMSDGFIIPLNNYSIINFIKEESNNIKFVKECFDFAYNKIQFNESGNRVFLTTTDGDILAVNLENYIAKELMNYSRDVFRKDY